MEFCDIVEESIKKYHSIAEVIKLPLADGGDGTVEVLEFYMGGKRVEIEVHDPFMQKIKASYLFSEEKKMAFIEMAHASGIRLLKREELNPLKTSTYGTGELIKHAIEKGAQQIIMGIGGRATNDAGMGMARALGYRFFDKNNIELMGKGEDLIKLHRIDDSNSSPLLEKTQFDIACDVDNPLFGPTGAAHIYAPQKGANEEMVEELDKGLRVFNDIAQDYSNTDYQNIAGAGAAGGLGAASILFLDAKLKSGINLIKDIAQFNEQIKDADWIITGEGKLDEQTFSGKVIKGVLDSRTTQNLAVFCGINELNSKEIEKHKISYLAEMRSFAKSIDDSINKSATYLRQAAENFAKSI
jgi:glycerate kinase